MFLVGLHILFLSLKIFEVLRHCKANRHILSGSNAPIVNEARHEKTCFGVSRSDTNWAVQPQKMARRLKWIQISPPFYNCSISFNLSCSLTLEGCWLTSPPDPRHRTHYLVIIYSNGVSWTNVSWMHIDLGVGLN